MTKRVVLIGAIAENGLYGYGRGVEGKIPWRSKQDMKFFRETTIGHTIVMGRGTWESIPPAYRPFVERVNFVVTNNPQFVLTKDDQEKGVRIFNSISNAIDAAPTEKVFVIGAKDIWYNTISHAHELLINRIGLTPSVDELHEPVFFRELLDPVSYFDGFVQEGVPVELCENPGTENAFSINCHRYLREITSS